MWSSLSKSKKGLVIGVLIGVLFGLYSNFISDCHSSVGGEMGECKNENFITEALIFTEFYISLPIIFLPFLEKWLYTTNGWIVITSIYYILFFGFVGYIIGRIKEKRL